MLHGANLVVVGGIYSILLWQSFLLYVVVAGETIYMPAPSISLTAKDIVPRRPGVVYFNTTSQSICFCYGVVTESTLMNHFAQVVEEDLPKLIRLGKVVYEQTIGERMPRIVAVAVVKPGEEVVSPAQDLTTMVNTRGSRLNGWKDVKNIIDQELAQLRRPQEPDDIKRIRLGAVASRAGESSSPFQIIIFLQGFLSTLSLHVFSRLLAISYYPEMTTALVIRQTREFLINTFNHFDFLTDLGLVRVRDIITLYGTTLGTIATLGEYRYLTDSMQTLIQLLYRWVHLIFPSFVKEQFQSRLADEVEGMPKMQLYIDYT